jgi:hypothetical protein
MLWIAYGPADAGPAKPSVHPTSTRAAAVTRVFHMESWAQGLLRFQLTDNRTRDYNAAMRSLSSRGLTVGAHFSELLRDSTCGAKAGKVGF